MAAHEQASNYPPLAQYKLQIVQMISTDDYVFVVTQLVI